MSDRLNNILRNEIKNKNAIFICGTGVSLSATGGKRPEMGWKGLLLNGLRFARDELGNIDDKNFEIYKAMLDEDDMINLISVAEIVEQKLGAPKGEFRRWLHSVFNEVNIEKSNILDKLKQFAEMGCLLATTNYDDLLEKITKYKPVTNEDIDEFDEIIKGKTKGILHLHGYWKKPESVVLGWKSYEKVKTDEKAKLIREVLRINKTMIFVGSGSGLEDPNIGNFLKWADETFADSKSRIYVLAHEKGVNEIRNNFPPNKHRIIAVNYGKNYKDLEPFLQSLIPSDITTTSKTGEGIQSTSDSKNSEFFEKINAFFIHGFAKEEKRMIDYFKSICRSFGIEPIFAEESGNFDARKVHITLREANCLVAILTPSVISDKKGIAWVNQVFGMAYAINLPVLALTEYSVSDKELVLIPNVTESIRFDASKAHEVLGDLFSFFYYVRALITGKSIQYLNEKRDVKSKLEKYANMYDSRLYVNYPAKQNIASYVLKNFISNETKGIMLDSGTLTYVIADALVESGLRIPIVTNNLAIVNKLKNVLNYPVFLLPGEFDSRTKAVGGQCTGEMARNFLKGEMNIPIDIAFLTANSIDIKSGLSADAQMFSDFRATILRHAPKLVIVLQGEKFLKEVSNPVLSMEEWDEVLEKRKQDSSIYFVIHKLVVNYGIEANHCYLDCIHQLRNRFPQSHVIEISD